MSNLTTLPASFQDALILGADAWYSKFSTGDYFQIRKIAEKNVLARMIEIEIVNAQYNRLTNFGDNPNGQEDAMADLLYEWNELKSLRNKSKATA